MRRWSSPMRFASPSRKNWFRLNNFCRISTPYIMIAGIIFFAFRFFVDSFNLLTVFKAEIESGGLLVSFEYKIINHFRSKAF